MSDGVRAWAWLAILLAFAAMGPTACAQGQQVILSATAEVVIPLDVGTFVDNESRYLPAAPAPNPAAPTVPTVGGVVPQISTTSQFCGKPTIVESPRQFLFTETRASRTDCGEFGFRYVPPEGVQRFYLDFEANRSLPADANQTAAGSPPASAPRGTSIREIQELRIRDDTDAVVLIADVFSATAGDQPFTPFTFLIAVPPGSSAVNITWYFEDRGSEVTSTGATTASTINFTAAVRNPTIRMADYPVDFGAVINKSEVVDGDDLITTTLYSVRPPDLASLNATLQGFTFRIPSTANLTELIAPDNARIPFEELNSTRSPQGIDVYLSSDFIERHGTGTYALAFVSRAPAPPPPPPPPPTTIYPVILGLMIAPAFPSVLAGRAGFVYRKEARGAYVRTAALIAAGIFVLVALWLLIVVYAFGLQRFATMATLPFAPEAWLLNIALLVILFGLIALWIIPGRYALDAMRSDLAERRKQAKELQRSNLELEHFAYIASHDLQEPLRTISGFAQLLERRYGEKLDDRARMYIERQVAGTQRMQALINDLLAYSRVQTQGKPFVDVDLDAEVAAMLTDLETFIRERHATVTKPALPKVKGDGSQIVQVFSNLVRNGIKYRSPEREPVVAITVTADDAAKEWVFAVADNGKGIAPEYFEKIFIIFQRLEARDDGGEQGTGLGLAITKKIVERHGGRIWVESQVGAGSTFRFTIPYEPGEPR